MITPDRRWNACVEVVVLAWAAPEPPDIQTGEDDDYCMASTRRDGVWNDRGVADPPLCCWRPTEHHGRHHDPYQHLDWEIDDDNDAMPGAREAVAERDLLVVMLARTYSLLPPDRVALVDDGVDEMVARAAQPAAPADLDRTEPPDPYGFTAREDARDLAAAPEAEGDGPCPDPGCDRAHGFDRWHAAAPEAEPEDALVAAIRATETDRGAYVSARFGPGFLEWEVKHTVPAPEAELECCDLFPFCAHPAPR